MNRILSISIPEDIYSLIEQRAKEECRTKNSQILYLMKLGIQYREEANARAMSLLTKHQQKSSECP